jgi:hypothetical protein
MRDDVPPSSRLARQRANPWRVNLWLDPSLKRSRHHGAPLPSPRASEGGTVVSTVKDTRTRNFSDKENTLCACTAETAMLP